MPTKIYNNVSVLEKIKDIMFNNFNINKNKVTPKAKIKNLGIDSFGLVELAFEIEQMFKIKVKDEDLEQITTINDIIHCIENKI